MTDVALERKGRDGRKETHLSSVAPCATSAFNRDVL
jgi:hypothetical protein